MAVALPRPRPPLQTATTSAADHPLFPTTRPAWLNQTVSRTSAPAPERKNIPRTAGSAGVVIVLATQARAYRMRPRTSVLAHRATDAPAGRRESARPEHPPRSAHRPAPPPAWC